MILFISIVLATITNSDYDADDFNDVKFMVASVPTSTTFTITMDAVESGSGATTSGGIRIQMYYSVGPAQQLGAYGWGIGQYSGTVSGEVSTTLDGAITDAAATSGITLDESTDFPSSGTSYVQIDSEEISYTGISSSVLTGVTRGVRNTTAATHADGATVTNTTDYVGWGEAASGDKVFNPGMWSLDNYGTTLIALIFNGACFQWDSTASAATSTRATIISGAPTASRDMLVFYTRSTLSVLRNGNHDW